MSTGCESYADALVERARGRLEVGRARQVEAHLETCGDCRAALAVIEAVQRAAVEVPDGLEARLQAAVRGPAHSAGPAAVPDAGDPVRAGVASERPARTPTGRWPRRGAWALPLAAAAALAIWLGAELLGPPNGESAGEVAAEVEPYGAWPASDGVVAGELVLSELSVEELEALLEEMEP